MARPNNQARDDGWDSGALLALVALLCCAAPLLVVLLWGTLSGAVLAFLAPAAPFIAIAVAALGAVGVGWWYWHRRTREARRS
jgi:hypothetical protein